MTSKAEAWAAQSEAASQRWEELRLMLSRKDVLDASAYITVEISHKPNRGLGVFIRELDSTCGSPVWISAQEMLTIAEWAMDVLGDPK